MFENFDMTDEEIFNEWKSEQYSKELIVGEST